MNGLSAQGAEYARLLMDPCAAKLTHPVYSGAEGGILIRAESFATYGAGTNTAGVLHWTPGAIGATNTELLVAGADTAVLSVPMAATTAAPGKTYLAANAVAVRVVAACLIVTYPGSELSRSGRVHYGHTSGALIDLGDSLNSDQVSGTLEHFERTPATAIEIVWKPNDADQLFTDPNATTLASEKDRKAAITFSWAGLPASTGLTFKFVAVYEYQPVRALGIANPSMSRSTAPETLDRVLNYISGTGFKYVMSAAKQVMNMTMYGTHSTARLGY